MLMNGRVMIQAKTLIVVFLRWVKSIFVCTPIKNLYPKWGCSELHTVLKWSALIAPAHRRIETVSAALLHIRTNLPLSNFIQPWLVTAEESCMLWARALTSRRFRVMRRGAWWGTHSKWSASGGWADSPSYHQEINLFCGEPSVCYHTDGCEEHR